MSDNVNARMIEAKTLVERRKKVVRDLQASLTQLRGPSRERAKTEWQRQLGLLSDAKLELVKLSGTGPDPKWALIGRAWAVLTRLNETGVEIGALGEKLLEDIEFHMPTSKLIAELDALDPPANEGARS